MRKCKEVLSCNCENLKNEKMLGKKDVCRNSNRFVTNNKWMNSTCIIRKHLKNAPLYDCNTFCILNLDLFLKLNVFCILNLSLFSSCTIIAQFLYPKNFYCTKIERFLYPKFKLYKNRTRLIHYKKLHGHFYPKNCSNCMISTRT